MSVREFHRFTRLCFTLLGSFCVTTTPALSATTDPPPGQPIPWNQLGSQATTQYSGDGLAVNATADGARLRCVFQKLEAEVTAAGLWLRSTATGAADRAQVVADRLRRDAGPTILLERRGRVDLATGHARYIRPRLIEEYSVSVDGIRQDFVVTDPPAMNFHSATFAVTNSIVASYDAGTHGNPAVAPSPVDAGLDRDHRSGNIGWRRSASGARRLDSSGRMVSMKLQHVIL